MTDMTETFVAAVAIGSTDPFAVGLVIGVLIGLAAAPLLRSALIVREWRRASREARLTEELLWRIERDTVPHRSGDPSPAKGIGRG